nr:EAL domain-containing protein [Vibrio sp. Y2-5]
MGAMNLHDMTYVGKQPIFDRSLQAVGFEMLYRDSDKNCFPSHVSSRDATASIISHQLLYGLHQQEEHGADYFVNFDQRTILDQYPKLLPAHKVVIEILESAKPDTALTSSLTELHTLGYRIALDDFNIEQYELWSQILPYVYIVKIDVLNFDVFSSDVIRILEQLKHQFPNLKLLAEKVESESVMTHCLKFGFDFFQGYYLSKPEVLSFVTVKPLEKTYAEVYSLLQNETFDIDAIARVIKNDAGFSSRLHNFSTSDNINRKDREEPINLHHAIATLGKDLFNVFLDITGAPSSTANA